MKIRNVGVGIAVVSVMAVIAFGCSKKADQKTNLAGMGLEGEDKDVVTQTVSSSEQEAATAVPVQVQPVKGEAAAVATTAAIPMPSDELEKNKQIQTALKNASLYTGNIDGKIGPVTKKAIEEFQKSKGLKADGKVGSKTWAELQKYVTGTVSAAANEVVVNTVPPSKTR
ncbi:MAG: peptidoglycan-binding domain-containing protein [Candidatus Omnitrophota bacterium]